MTPFAFVFPGQGSQSVGMLDAWGDHPAVRQTLEEASSVLDQDLAALISQGPKDALSLTTNTQPVMLTAAIACWRAWLAEGGPQPVALAGHSLGEITALVAAQAIRFSDALPLVRFRAQAMQEAVAVGEGAMAAILGLEATVVKSLCAQVSAESGQVVEAANFNDPSQTVISGAAASVAAACEALKAAGAKRTLPLPVSAPFHSSLMKPAAERLQARLKTLDIQPPRLPVVNNIDVAVQSEPDAIRDALARQAFGPVRWVEVVQRLRSMGITMIMECGPGKVLTGTVKRIDPQIQSVALFDPATLAEAKGLLS